MPLKRTPMQQAEYRLRRCPVHHALAIDEILQMITFEVRTPWKMNRTLLALAVTCKAWSPVALDELWKEITTGELAAISSIRNECIASNRPDIYTEFLRKTQVLIHHSSPDEIADIWSALPTFRPHTIICHDTTRPIQTSVLAPYITHLIFDHTPPIWDAAWIEKFSKDLQKISSSLEVLTISLVPRISSMMGLSHLGALQSLQKLQLKLTDGCTYAWAPDEPFNGSSWLSSDERGLVALEEMDIEAPIFIVQAILDITGSKLRNLRITGTPYESATVVSDLFERISRGPWATGITHLRYGISNRWPLAGTWDECLEYWGLGHAAWGFTHPKRETVLVTSQHIQALLRLGSLTHLALAFHIRPQIDDLFFGSLARKLPLLQNLCISGRDRTDDTYPLATLESVLALAQLPSLRALHIPFDVRVDDGTTIAVEPPFSSLTRLCVSDGPPPTECGTITAIVATLFPKLRQVYCLDTPSEDSRCEGWRSLWRTWESCQTALGKCDARPLEIEEVLPVHDDDDDDGEDFFIKAVADSIGFGAAETGSEDDFNFSVDPDEHNSIGFNADEVDPVDDLDCSVDRDGPRYHTGAAGAHDHMVLSSTWNRRPWRV